MKSKHEILLILNYLEDMIAAAKLNASGKVDETNAMLKKAELVAESLKMNHNEVLKEAKKLLKDYL